MALKSGQAGKRAEHRALSAERTAQLIKDRRSGIPGVQLAATYGISTTHVSRLIHKAMYEARETMLDQAELYRVEAIERLGLLLNACWDAAMNGSDKHIAEARRIIDSMAKYTGAQLPVVIEIGESDVDRALRELTELLDSRSAEAEG